MSAFENPEIQLRYWFHMVFGPWMEKKAVLLKEATDAFTAVVSFEAPEWTIQAAARAGDMQLDMARAIGLAPFPFSGEGSELPSRAFRASMIEGAEPYRQAAVHGYSYCFDKAMKANWLDERATYCAEKLREIEPRSAMAQDEILPASPSSEPEFWAEPAIAEECQFRHTALGAAESPLEHIETLEPLAGLEKTSLGDRYDNTP